MSRQDSSKGDETDAQEIETIPMLEMSPLYKCDKYEKESRTCSYVRQIGTTLTLGVQLEQSDKKAHHRIRWFRYYKQRAKEEDLKIEFTKKSSPWNINIGRASTELRISPLTEIDFSYNYFEARIDDTQDLLSQKVKLENKSGNHLMAIKFIVEPINIDMGSLYPGEELSIYARAFIDLPMRSVVLEWSMEDPFFKDLPSNMRVIGDGSSVVVNELKARVDRVLICSVFTNRGIFVARRNFLFRKIAQVNTQDLLRFTPKVKFKSRKRRSTEENPAFEFPDYETMDRYNPTLNQEKLERLHNANEEYSNNQKQLIDPAYSNNHQYQGDQDSDSMAINNKLFYRDENELEPNNKNANTRKSTQKDTFSQRSLRHGSQFSVDQLDHLISRLRGNPRNGLRAARRIQEESANGEDLNNNGEFLKRKMRYDGRKKSKVGRRRNQYVPQKEDSQKSNQLVVETEEDDRPSNEELVEKTDNDQYTFDEKESMLIADCAEDQDCNSNAVCVKKPGGKRFCKCVSRYQGNGIFCWLI